MVDTLTNIRGDSVDENEIARFRDALAGQAIAPGDPDYETARHIWNASIDKRPGLIARCASADDVVKAVDFARANGILVAVRGGGHNVGGRALCDDGLVIDLSPMRKIDVDADARVVVAQAGCTLGDLDAATHPKGLVVPAGVFTKTGIAGLTLGGGVGWLVRKYGLTCDNVLSFELVTADGQVVTASADENEDLFWGLRGGGGNFGVVVSFTYQAHPLTTVLGGLLVHPRDRAGEVLRFYRDFMADAPDELTAYAALLHTPDGDPVAGIVPCWCGDLQEGEDYLRPLREFGPPLVDAVASVPFPHMQALFDDAFPDGNQNYWKSTFVRELSDDAIDILVEHANAAPSPLTAIVIELYGGAMARVGPDETAFGHRSADYDVGILSQWTDPADTDRNVAWTRALYDALQPYWSGAFLLNFLDRDEDAAIRTSFGPNYDRLAALKAKYDPENFFRQNHNISPARGKG
jgi:FAD/FMN-containing dehydrogenase